MAGRYMRTVKLANYYDLLAPDGSEIRELLALKGCSMVHSTLPPHGVSKAIQHQSVEEIWFILGGRGRLWRRVGDDETTVPLETGVSVDIPLGTWFQFRNAGDEPLRFIIVTMPPWPGPDEAVPVEDHWPVASTSP